MDTWSIAFPAGMIFGALITVWGGWFEFVFDRAEVARKAKLEVLKEVDEMLDKQIGKTQ